MAEVPETLEGWYVLHDFRRFDWRRFKQLSRTEQESITGEAAAFFADAESVADATEGSSALYTLPGHRGDLLILHLRPEIDQLAALKRSFARTAFADFTEPVYSYLSVTELSLYEAAARGGNADPDALMRSEFVQRRLKPRIPDMRYILFYPMNKRRTGEENWYTADFETRRQLMQQHGATGRKYQDRVIQMITGSTGLDDWEWGVTLFTRDPLLFKKLVYEMRFDEVSARYAEFGPFLVGIRVPPAGLPEICQG